MPVSSANWFRLSSCSFRMIRTDSPTLTAVRRLAGRNRLIIGHGLFRHRRFASLRCPFDAFFAQPRHDRVTADVAAALWVVAPDPLDILIRRYVDRNNRPG